MTETTKTTCPYCGVGCGVLATLDDFGVVTIKGDKEHPANHGRLCSKGTALGETVYLQDRLLYPEINGEQVDWQEALAHVAGEFKQIISAHGPDSVAFYVSGQLLTEDYYVANKLMKGFIGSANIDTNSRLCMSSAVAAHKRAFGEDCVPGNYADLEQARMIILTGSNTAWCHPVIYQRIALAKKNNPDLFIVLIDPRKTQTAGIADCHLAIKPATDSILFNGLLTYLNANGAQHTAYTQNFTQGLDEALKVAQQTAPNIAQVAIACGLDETDVRQFYSLFLNTERVVTAFSQGINQSSSGVDKINAIINCHLFTGRIGRPGMGPFSLTGQPNAMGGREVGGLANQLAAHMDLENPRHTDAVQRFWQSPKIATRVGYKAVDLFNAIEKGKIKAVWIIATNPVVSLPDADRVKAALKKCDLVVVSDCVRETDTARLAHIKLPALTWGERDGTVTNSERCISRQYPFLPPPGQAKPDWWIITQVARHMGFGDAFNYRSPYDIFKEHAALSGFENHGDRQFDISGLATITYADYQSLKPVQWPVNSKHLRGKSRLYADGLFSTLNKKACFIPIHPKPPGDLPNRDYPLVLNTGRVRDQWHTMTRTGMSPRLSAHTYEPYVEIHPVDAQDYQVKDKQLAIVSSPLGSIYVRVKVSQEQQPGSVFVPMHWSEQFSSRARVDTLIKALVDPLSGQPESKHGIARIEPCAPNWYGFILSRHGKHQLKYASYWARSRGKGLWRYELAGEDQPEDWAERARSLLFNEQDNASWAEYMDTAHNHYRAAHFIGSKLESCIFIGPDSELPERDWLISLFQKDQLNKAERMALLTGKPPVSQEDKGKIVCVCFGVGEKQIIKAIKTQGLTSVEDIGQHLQAGTNCGSCLPEISELLQKVRKEET